MKRHLALSAALGVLLICGVSDLSAGAKYEITLASGATYTVEKVDPDTFNVANSSGELVGYLRAASGGGLEVFDAEDNLLGSTQYVNPDALEMIDEHLGAEE